MGDCGRIIDAWKSSAFTAAGRRVIAREHKKPVSALSLGTKCENPVHQHRRFRIQSVVERDPKETTRVAKPKLNQQPWALGARLFVLRGFAMLRAVGRR